MKYRMLALDLDGTLLDSAGNLPDAHRDAVDRARRDGMLVVLCTGRSLCEARHVIEQLNHDGPVVLAGGALVTDPTTGTTLHAATIEPGLVRRLVTHLRREDHAVLVLLDPDPADHDYLVVDAHKLTDNTRWWFHHIHADLRCVEDPAPRDLHHVLRVGIVAPEHHMPPIQAELLQKFADRVFVQHFLAIKQADGQEMHVLECFARHVHKWSGLQWLARRHNIAPERIAAVGDHVNDVSMIESAGCGIAMANAVHPVLQAADRVTGSNDDTGVADAVDHLLAGDW